MDFLKSAVASAIAKGSALPCTIGDRLDNSDSVFALHKGTRREDGSDCCILIFEIASNKSRLPLARNAARKLRTFRHPGVIKVVDVIESETHIYIVTEKVTPLSWHVKRKSLSEETTKWGLYNVASTLKFINMDAASVHGNIRVSSVYTSESGEWKLGGFEILSSMNDNEAIIYNYGSLVPNSGRYAPPEIVSNGWSAIKAYPLAAPDAYGLGTLIFEAFNGSFMGTDQIQQARNVPSNMANSFKRLINANPRVRLTSAAFLEQGNKRGGFFQTPLIQITEGVNSLGLKNDSERDEFMKELDGLNDDFPEDFFKMKILPELLKSVEFGGGGPQVFSAIMKISKKLSDDEFESWLAPVIVRLFNSSDRAMRVCLLDNLPLMVDRISQKDINNKIFPSMVTGFTDTAPVVREQTVKAVLAVISKLSDRTINGELLRYLAKTANDEQPGIRTNTTICLGKIARNLGSASRSKVLIAAFTRSLRDPFVHARSAALLALSATIDTFNEEDCASKILPSLCMPLIDKEKMVRDQASKTMDVYLHRVKKFASTMPDSALPPESNISGAASTARIGDKTDTSWAGWAISSFTNKISTARGQMQTPAINGNNTLLPRSQPTSGRATPALLTGPTSPTSRSAGLSKTTTVSPAQESREEPEDVLDAWGTMDDEEDSFFDAHASTRKSAEQEEARVNFDDGGEPDFAGWLAAQSKAKSKPPLPKGLSRPAATSARSLSRPMVAGRSKSSGPVTGTGLAKALTSKSAGPQSTVPNQVNPKAREPDSVDDDWGAAWD